MRIAYLTTQYPKVSHTFIRREILELEKRGHSIMRLAIRKSEFGIVDPLDLDEETKVIQCLTESPFAIAASLFRVAIGRPLRLVKTALIAMRMSRLSDRGLLRHFAYLLEAAFFLHRLEAEQIAHVHVHFGRNAAAVARLILHLGGPPYSMTIHGPGEWDASIGYSIGPKIEDASFTAVISSFGMAQAQRWVGPGHWPKIHVVRCAVDNRFFAEAVPIPEGSNTFIMIGRLTAQKAPLLLIDAFAELADAGFEARLLLAGDGELRDLVTEKITACKLENHVQITGWISEKQVRTCLRDSRCLILPSSNEGLPVVIMEAMAMARPIITTFVAGIPELVLPGENGWLIPAGDREKLVGAMKEVLSLSETELDTRGRAGAKRVRMLHDLETEVTKLERLFVESIRS